MKYLIAATPRSRTFWLSRMLGAKHDPMLEVGSLEEFCALEGGVVDTLALSWLPQIRKLEPGLKIVILRRPQLQVMESMKAAGLPTESVEHLCAASWHFAHLADMVVPYGDLDFRAYELCSFLGVRHDGFAWENARTEHKTRNYDTNMTVPRFVRDRMEELGWLASQ